MNNYLEVIETDIKELEYLAKIKNNIKGSSFILDLVKIYKKALDCKNDKCVYKYAHLISHYMVDSFPYPREELKLDGLGMILRDSHYKDVALRRNKIKIKQKLKKLFQRFGLS